MNIIDTRDLITEANDLAGGDWESPDDKTMAELEEDERERFDVISDLLNEMGPDAHYGVALVPESDFEDHARELAEDIGAVDENMGWPHSCIDWERAARELQMDYTMISFDGTDYLYRA